MPDHMYQLALNISSKYAPVIDKLADDLVKDMEEVCQHWKKEGNGYMESLDWLLFSAAIIRLTRIEYAFTFASLRSGPNLEEEGEEEND